MNEQDLKRAVERIQMNLVLKDKVMVATISPRQEHTAHHLQKAALCFGAILALVLGGLWGRLNPFPPPDKNQFSLVVAVAEQKESTMKKGEPIKLQTYSTNYYTPRTLDLPDGSQEWKTYNVLTLNCRGENIKSITYGPDHIGFVKIVVLNKKQADDLTKEFMEIDNKKGNYYAEDYATDPRVSDTMGINPENWNIPQHFNLERYPKEDPTQVNWGYRTAGKNYTITYEDQNDLGKQYGYKLSSYVSAEALAKVKAEWVKIIAGLSDKQLEKLREDPSFKDPWIELEISILSGMTSQINGSILRTIVAFNGGSMQTRNVRLNADENGFNLTATPLD